MTTAKEWRLAVDAVEAQLEAHGIYNEPFYDTWEKGDVCGIEGEAGIFVFQSVRVNANGDPLHVNVVGGPVWGQKQTREWRSFAVDRLTTKQAKNTTRVKAAWWDEGDDDVL